jgi:ribonuclease P protein component
VLPAAARLTSGESFRRGVREGRRAGSRTLVVHLTAPGGQDPEDTRDADDAVAGDRPARVGFVVGKAVGRAVVRNRVRRRLRHLVRDRLAELPAGSVLVVRALASSADATYDELRADLARCLGRVATAAAR